MDNQPSFWTTLPGILTGLTALVTAVGGFIAVLYGTGIIGGQGAPPPVSPSPTETPIASPTSTSVTRGGGGTLETATNNPTLTALPDSPEQLAIVIAKRNPNNVVSVLKDGDSLTSADYYGIYFRPVEAAYVYVFQKDSSGVLDVLFPNASYSLETNPVTGSSEVWVPKDTDNWFFLDEILGKEAIVVAVSRERNQELESLLSSPDATQSDLKKWFDSPDRGVGGVKKIVEKPVILSDGSAEVLSEILLGFSNEDDRDLVYQVEFTHD